MKPVAAFEKQGSGPSLPFFVSINQGNHCRPIGRSGVSPSGNPVEEAR